jgi:predicted alpha/beta superfamily hydrolase
VKRSILLVFLSILLLGLFFVAVDENECRGYRGKTITTRLYSENTGSEYKIVVYLPKSYEAQKNKDKHYPVIYQLNGNYHGRTTAIMAAHLSCRKVIDTEAIVVAVGYDTGASHDTRERDYVYVAPVNTETLEFREKDGKGGGKKFFEFLKAELIPYIDKHYRTDNKTYGRTLAGHSLAGYFTLLAMFKDHGPEQPLEDHFRNFIAAAPVVVNQWHYLFALEKQMARYNWAKVRANLFVGMSKMDENGTFENFDVFKRYMAKRKYPGLHLKMREYKRLRHIQTAGPVFEEGLQFIFGR